MPFLMGGTIREATVKLVQAIMLWNRSAARELGPVYRYIAFDASPQHGQEIFVTVERVVSRSALRGLGQHDRPALVGGGSRELPISILGTGRAGLAEKTQAHLHQAWLEYGPALEDVRLHCASVLSALSDMGTEFGIADALDVVGPAVGPALGPAVGPALGQQAGDNDDVNYLFPRAIRVPGTQHIIDNALLKSFESQDWWPSFQASLKIVAQWLRPVTNRRYLKSRLPARDSALKPALDVGCDRFAHWRWKTLATVCADLVRLEASVRSAVGRIASATVLPTRDHQFVF